MFVANPLSRGLPTLGVSWMILVIDVRPLDTRASSPLSSSLHDCRPRPVAEVHLPSITTSATPVAGAEGAVALDGFDDAGDWANDTDSRKPVYGSIKVVLVNGAPLTGARSDSPSSNTLLLKPSRSPSTSIPSRCCVHFSRTIF